jgi:hypothetical protein
MLNYRFWMVRGIVLGLGRSLALYITSEALGRLLLRPNHGHNVEVRLFREMIVEMTVELYSHHTE